MLDQPALDIAENNAIARVVLGVGWVTRVDVDGAEAQLQVSMRPVRVIARRHAPAHPAWYRRLRPSLPRTPSASP